MPISRSEGWKIALSIPGTEEVLWFKKPAVFLHGQFLTKVHDKEDAMTLRVSSMEMRDMMLEVKPKLFYLTEHYRNFPFILARLTALTPKLLKEILVGRAAQLAEKPVKKVCKPAKNQKANQTLTLAGAGSRHAIEVQNRFRARMACASRACRARPVVGAGNRLSPDRRLGRRQTDRRRHRLDDPAALALAARRHDGGIFFTDRRRHSGFRGPVLS